MSELDKLNRNLRKLSGDVARVQKPVDRTHAAARGTKLVLAKPAQLSRSMKWLASKAKSLRLTALFLMPFPVIGTLAGQIARILRSVRSTAERIKRAADRMNRNIAPAKRAVSKVDPPVSKAKQSLDRAQALLQGWLSVTSELGRRVGDEQREGVESLCADINKALAPELTAVAAKREALTRSLNATAAGLEGVVKAGGPLRETIEAAADVERSLRPLDRPLRQLDKALRPIKWALDAVGWVTRKVVDPVVNEILKAVGLKRLVNRLERRLNPLARVAAPLERAVDGMENSLAKMGNTAALATSLRAVAEIEKRVVSAMRPLSRVPAL